MSVEPDPKMFEICRKNLELNINYTQNVSIQNFAVSAKTGRVLFAKQKNRNILSDIVFTGHDETFTPTIQVMSLVDMISRFHTNLAKKLVIKIDIEGAEWQILKNKECLNSLKQHNALMLLATHPGFYRPFQRKLRGLDYFRFKIWNYRNYRESKKVFNLISKQSRIFRTNMDPIIYNKSFANLIRAGYNEFIVDFR